MNATDLKKYIFENEKIPIILEDLGCSRIKYHPNKDYYSATQPDGDNPNGVYISNNEYMNYASYTRDVSLTDNHDLIYFVEQVKKTNFTESLKYLHSLLSLPWRKTYKPKKKKEENDPLKIFKQYTKERYDVSELSLQDIDDHWRQTTDFVPMVHIDYYREGITKKTIRKFGLMYSYKHHRTIIPFKYWRTGKVIGYNARTSIKNYEELGIAKYWITPGMNKTINLYGLWENLEDIERIGRIVIYESEKSVHKRDSLGDPTGVAISGHYLSTEQVRIILSLNVSEVVIAMDKDVSILQVMSMADKIYKYKHVSFIYDKYKLLGDKDSPADACMVDYDKLFESRITYTETWHKRFVEEMKKK